MWEAMPPLPPNPSPNTASPPTPTPPPPIQFRYLCLGMLSDLSGMLHGCGVMRSSDEFKVAYQCKYF